MSRGGFLLIRSHPSSLRFGPNLGDEVGRERSPIGCVVVDIAPRVGFVAKERDIDFVGRQERISHGLRFLKEAIVHCLQGFAVNSAATQGDGAHGWQVKEKLAVDGCKANGRAN